MQVLDAEIIEDVGRNGDDLRIRRRSIRPEAFHAELVEFTQPARLRLFIPVAGGQVADLLRQGLVMQAVLKKSAHRTRRPFRAQGNGAAAFVVEGIHFFLHNVGGITDGALEQLRVLENRRANFMVAEMLSNFEHGLLHVLVFIALCGQRILCALNALREQRHCCDHPSSAGRLGNLFFKPSVPASPAREKLIELFLSIFTCSYIFDV